MRQFIRYIITFFFGFYLKRKRVIVAPNCILTRATTFGGKNRVNGNCNIANSIIGTGTYIGANCSLANVLIGNYCSIAQNVKVISATHPTSKFVSTHPAFFSVAKQAGFTYADELKFEETIYWNKDKAICVHIGNDVWIGEDVKIIGGIEIGNGAIIAAGAVVTKNVLPYSIVGGVPAKLIKFRFPEDQIVFLQKFNWWDKNDEWIHKNSATFCDMELFYKKFKSCI